MRRHIMTRMLLCCPRRVNTLTDNLGDVLKEYEHFTHTEGPWWWAAFKMGKYMDRMLEAVPMVISQEDLHTIKQTAEFKECTKLAGQLVLSPHAHAVLAHASRLAFRPPLGWSHD